MWEIIWDVLLDALVDSLKMLPFLFAAYLLIEYIERKKSASIERALAKGGRWGFVPGALLGLLPQCGFSAMAADFYGSGVITLGTLMAVFISTSDEAVLILLAHPSAYWQMFLLSGIKLVYALLVGFLLDFVIPVPKAMRGGYAGKASEVDCHEHEEEDGIFKSALKHTASIFAYVVAFTFLFGLVVAFVGEARITAFLGGLGYIQPLVAALLGLVPNCAASILLTQLMINGTISFGSALAGLTANAGVGLTVLFKANRNKKQCLFIVGMLYVLGAALGVVLHLLGL